MPSYNDGSTFISIPVKSVGDQLSHIEFNEIVDALQGKGAKKNINTQNIETKGMITSQGDINALANLNIQGKTTSTGPIEALSTILARNDIMTNTNLHADRNLYVNQNAYIEGLFDVTGNSYFRSDVTIEKAVLYIKGEENNANVGNVVVDNDIISNFGTIRANVGNVEAGGNLISTDGVLRTGGPYTNYMEGSLIVKKNVTVSEGSLNVKTGVTNLMDTSINGELNVIEGHNLNVSGNATVQKSMTVFGRITGQNELIIKGYADISSGAIIKGLLANSIVPGISSKVNLAFIDSSPENIRWTSVVDGRQYVASDMVVGGKLQSAGDAYIQGSTRLEGDVQIKGSLDVDKETSLHSFLTVDKTITGKDSVHIHKKLYAGQGNTPEQAADPNNYTVFFNGSTQVGGGGHFYATGPSTFEKKMTARDDINVKKNLYVQGTATVDKETVLNDTLHVEKDATFAANAVVQGNATINKKLSVDGTSTLKGDTHIQSKLTVDKTTNLKDNLNVDKDVWIKGKLAVDDETALRNSLTVYRGTNLINKLTVGGETYLKDALEVDKATTLNDRLIVNKKALMKDDLQVNKDALVHGTLTVNKDTSLNEKLTVANDTHIKKNTTIGEADFKIVYVQTSDSAPEDGKTYYDQHISYTQTIRDLTIPNTNPSSLNLYENTTVYDPTQDTTVNASKRYFRGVLVYNEVIPTSDPSALGLFEIEYEYKKTTDTTVDPDKTYYRYRSGRYEVVADPTSYSITSLYERFLKRYFETSDTTVDDTKIYFEEILRYEEEPNPGSNPASAGLFEPRNVYVKTKDKTVDDLKTYYERNEEYTPTTTDLTSGSPNPSSLNLYEETEVPVPRGDTKLNVYGDTHIYRDLKVDVDITAESVIADYGNALHMKMGDACIGVNEFNTGIRVEETQYKNPFYRPSVPLKTPDRIAYVSFTPIAAANVVGHSPKDEGWYINDGAYVPSQDVVVQPGVVYFERIEKPYYHTVLTELEKYRDPFEEGWFEITDVATSDDLLPYDGKKYFKMEEVLVDPSDPYSASYTQVLQLTDVIGKNPKEEGWVIIDEAVTNDTTVVEGKMYFRKTVLNNLDAYIQIYDQTVLSNSSTNPKTENWYEININTEKEYFTKTTVSGRDVYTQVLDTDGKVPKNEGWLEFVKTASTDYIPEEGTNAKKYYVWSIDSTSKASVYTEVDPAIYKKNPVEKGVYEKDDINYALSTDTTYNVNKTYYVRNVNRIVYDQVTDLVGKRPSEENWLEMTVTPATEWMPVSGKTYFTVKGDGTAGNPFVYSEVLNPASNRKPNKEGWVLISNVRQTTDNTVTSGKRYFTQREKQYDYPVATVQSTDNPATKGWYVLELTADYIPYTDIDRDDNRTYFRMYKEIYEFPKVNAPNREDNPSSLGWYILDNDEYTLSTDDRPDEDLTYYNRNARNVSDNANIYEFYTFTAVPSVNDENPRVEKWYEMNNVTQKFFATTDTEVNSSKVYYTKEEILYTYDRAETTQAYFNPSKNDWFEYDGKTIIRTKDSSVVPNKKYYLRTLKIRKLPTGIKPGKIPMVEMKLDEKRYYVDPRILSIMSVLGMISVQRKNPDYSYTPFFYVPDADLEYSLTLPKKGGTDTFTNIIDAISSLAQRITALEK